MADVIHFMISARTKMFVNYPPLDVSHFTVDGRSSFPPDASDLRPGSRGRRH